MMRNSEPSQNAEQPGLPFIPSTSDSEQVTRIAFTPVRETAPAAPVHAPCREIAAIENERLPAFEERQTSPANEADVTPAPAPAPALPPNAVMIAPDRQSELTPRGRTGWIAATVALVVSAVVVSGFALVSLLRVGQAPSVAGSTPKREPVSNAPAIAIVPPVIPGTVRPPAVMPATDPPAVALDAAAPKTPLEANAMVRPLTNAAPLLTGTVQLAIKPWGQVIVDGVTVGVTPPLKRLTLPQGQHKVQIVNPGFVTYLARIEVRKDNAVTVTYEFK